jgi:DnaJ-class molecular chaperone
MFIFLNIAYYAHTDRNRDNIENATEKFKEIQHAYSVLKNREQGIMESDDEGDDDEQEQQVNKLCLFFLHCTQNIFKKTHTQQEQHTILEVL